jgi:UDP-N-acetyl-D-mannosaminuronate dehydrogenase
LYGYDAVASSEEIESIGLSYHDINSGFDEFDAVLFLNNHTKFQKINPFNMVSNMKEKPIIFDGWDLFQEKEILSVKPSIYLGLSNILSSIKGIKV